VEPIYVDPREFAEALTGRGVPTSPRTLERWRRHGRGPRFVRVEGRVFYLRGELDRLAPPPAEPLR